MKSYLKGQDRNRVRGAVLVGVVVGTAALLLYLSTLAPTVLDFEPPETFDSPMLQAGAYTLGIGHPTGYPTYMTLTHLFTYLPFGDPGYRTNLASAVYAAAAVGALYAAGLLLSRRVYAAAAGALGFAVSPTFWSQATIAEVYTLNALFIALVLFVLLLWREHRRDRHLLLAAFLMGLSLTHHLTSAPLLPAAIVFVILTDGRRLLDSKLLLKGAGLFLVGLTPYLYLPLRAAMEAPLNEADPSTLGRFLLLVTGGSFLLKNLRDAGGVTPGPDEPAASPQSVLDPLLARLPDYWGFVSDQFPMVLLFFGVIGIVCLISTDLPAAALLGVPFAGSLLHGLLYGFEDYFLFLIPAYLVFGLLVAAGLAAVMRWVERTAASPMLRHVLLIALCAVALAAPLVGAWGTYAEEDRSADYEGRRTIEAVTENVEPGATVLHHRSALWYMVLVEERRRDLTLIDPFETSWVRYEDIVWPDSIDAAEAAARYATDDITGVATARESAKTGPVYVLDPEKAYLSGFRNAGFEVVRAGQNTGLYELLPPRSDEPARSVR
ncbi:MAG TPA: DUF2723 domain-containing protein [Rubrobacteraceae bacterium]|nr:DUF2723 domain-containing protein [Rubrobacteraceae bacterium]